MTTGGNRILQSCLFWCSCFWPRFRLLGEQLLCCNTGAVKPKELEVFSPTWNTLEVIQFRIRFARTRVSLFERPKYI